MAFDFENLKRRIARQYGTHAAFALAAGYSPRHLVERLGNWSPFTVSEIRWIALLLDIPGDQIDLYFFTPKFDKIELEVTSDGLE